jgi:hypothetical protein
MAAVAVRRKDKIIFCLLYVLRIFPPKIRPTTSIAALAVKNDPDSVHHTAMHTGEKSYKCTPIKNWSAFTMAGATIFHSKKRVYEPKVCCRVSGFSFPYLPGKDEGAGRKRSAGKEEDGETGMIDEKHAKRRANNQAKAGSQ